MPDLLHIDFQYFMKVFVGLLCPISDKRVRARTTYNPTPVRFPINRTGVRLYYSFRKDFTGLASAAFKL